MIRASVRRVAGAVGAASLLVLMAGPAAHAATAPEKWGKTFCTALSDWGGAIQESGAELGDIDPDTLGPTQHQRLVLGFLDDVTGATEDFGDAVRKAGDPAVKKGRQIESTILGGIAGVEALLKSISTQVEQLPTTDTATYKAAAQPIELQLDNLSTPFEDAMDEVSSLEKKNELSKALEKVKACKQLGV